MKQLLPLFLLVAVALPAQVTLRVTSVPANTPEGATIYVAGSFNSWNPAATALVADGNGKYSCVIAEGKGTAEFKFTRGSWATVEGNATGKYLPNRTFSFTGSAQTLNLSILSWEDTGAGSPGTAATNVQILNNAFQIPQLNRTRRIWIYLPPDYQTSTKRYPVLYMHDGQNLFDNATAFAGEWQVDETLNRLHSEGDYGAIVVGIDNGGADRINEMTPWENTQYGGGEGDKYLQFIVETLKPYIDANFRTLAKAEHTALIGSSLGGLISTYGGVKYPNVFSKIGSFSPAYWIVSSELNSWLSAAPVNLSATRLYTVAGSNESASMVAEIEKVRANLQSKGIISIEKLDTYGQHNENYWKGEFEAAYKWLFTTTALSTDAVADKKPSVIASKNNLFVEGIPTNTIAWLYEISGKMVERITLSEGWNKLNTELSVGSYILKTEQDSIQFLIK